MQCGISGGCGPPREEGEGGLEVGVLEGGDEW